MIFIKSRSDKFVQIDVDLTVGRHLSFCFNCGDPAYAMLVARDIRNNLFSTLKDIRLQAYDQGWKDAKAKKRGKQEYFKGSW